MGIHLLSILRTTGSGKWNTGRNDMEQDTWPGPQEAEVLDKWRPQGWLWNGSGCSYRDTEAQEISVTVEASHWPPWLGSHRFGWREMVLAPNKGSRDHLALDQPPPPRSRQRSYFLEEETKAEKHKQKNSLNSWSVLFIRVGKLIWRGLQDHRTHLMTAELRLRGHLSKSKVLSPQGPAESNWKKPLRSIFSPWKEAVPLMVL